MADGQNAKVDFPGGMLVLGICILIVFFWGEPDIHDAIIHSLMGPDAAEVQVESPDSPQ